MNLKVFQKFNAIENFRLLSSYSMSSEEEQARVEAERAVTRSGYRKLMDQIADNEEDIVDAEETAAATAAAATAATATTITCNAITAANGATNARTVLIRRSASSRIRARGRIACSWVATRPKTMSIDPTTLAKFGTSWTMRRRRSLSAPWTWWTRS